MALSDHGMPAFGSAWMTLLCQDPAMQIFVGALERQAK